MSRSKSSSRAATPGSPDQWWAKDQRGSTDMCRSPSATDARSFSKVPPIATIRLTWFSFRRRTESPRSMRPDFRSKLVDLQLLAEALVRTRPPVLEGGRGAKRWSSSIPRWPVPGQRRQARDATVQSAGGSGTIRSLEILATPQTVDSWRTARLRLVWDGDDVSEPSVDASLGLFTSSLKPR